MREIAVTVTIGRLAKTPFWDLSVVQVCKEAEVASASFYNAFPGGKPELIRTIYERVSADLLAAMSEVPGPKSRNMVTAIRTFCLAPYLAWVQAHRVEASFLLQVEAGVLDGETRTAINQAHDRVRDLIASRLERIVSVEGANTSRKYYLEVAVLGPLQTAVASALRGAIDLSAVEKELPKLAAAALCSLKASS